MTAKRAYYGLIVIGLLALAACSPRGTQTATQPTVAASAPTPEPAPTDEPITLRLAIADPAVVVGEPAILEFIEQVRTRSDGNIVIEPVWEAPGYEEGVVAALKAGKYELGLAGSRAFDLQDVTVFQPLQTPFLIDNDALAIAVATSDAAAQMLDGLASAGMAGLTLWPEDLRHLFSVDVDQPLLSPEDVAGLTIRVPTSGVTHALVEALGGRTTFEDSGFQGAESGLVAARSSIEGRPTAAGNVTFFPKYAVLFANGAALERLSDEQRAVLHEAATATRDNAIANRPSSVDAGAAWCNEVGGAIVLASDEQLAAWVAAAQPVVDQIEADPANAEMVAAIRALKANTPPGPMIAACDGPADDGQTWSTGLPPNGVWTVELSVDDMAGMGLLGDDVTWTAGTYTLTLNDGIGVWGFTTEQGAGECEGDYSAVEDVTRWMTTDGPCAPVTDTQWRLEDDGLHFHLLDIQDGDFEGNRAILEAKPWQKVED